MGQRLKGRIAIITGSDSGIGRATAEAFAREGADVAITYFHDRSGAEQTRQSVEAAGGKALVVQVDQRDPAQVEKLFREAEEKLGARHPGQQRRQGLDRRPGGRHGARRLGR